MFHSRKYNPRSGMQTSPWIILGSSVILLIVVIVLAVQNTSREKRSMSKVLREKAVALIRAVEAGARTGMKGMMWGGHQIQKLLEETGGLPDVMYIAVLDKTGRIVAHSDPSKVDTLFRPGRKLVHLGSDLQENLELIDLGKHGRVFEVHRYFRPLQKGWRRPGAHMHEMMRQDKKHNASPHDWFSPQKREKLYIVVGLDVTPFEEAIRKDIRTTVMISAILLLLGFGGFVSLFWMHSYRAARSSLLDTSAFADEIVTHLPVGLIATDNEGRIRFFNAAAEKITGLHLSMMQNQQPNTLLPEKLCNLEQSLENGQIISDQEMECTFSGGHTVPLSVSATRILNNAGKFIGQILILRDLGEVRRLQDQVRRQEKLAAIGGLAAGVAHEIRNPLSSIKGLATFFANQFTDGSEAKEAASVMIQEVDRLNRVISELLDFARPTRLKRKLTDLEPLITRSVQLIQQDAASQNIKIKTGIANNISPVLIDPDRLTQCLLNLYLNAIEAMPKGGKLSIHCDNDTDGNVQLAISDTGQGIKAEHLHQVFDPYFTTKNKGTGLGLAIVHKIIEAHQARIKVKSSSDRGTAMVIQLPGHSDGI